MKINERSNVELPNLRVTAIENKNWEDKAPKFINIKGQIWESGKMATSVEYRMDKQFRNLLIFGISIVFQIEKIRKIC